MVTRSRLRIVAWALVLVGFGWIALTILVPLGGYALGVVPCITRPDRFDAEAWRATDIDALCNARVLMADDLLASDELRPGRPRDEVLALLGPTEDTEYPRGGTSGLAYVTGCWIDCTWLVVSFDDDARLEEAYLASD